MTAYSCMHPSAAVSDARAWARARMRLPGPTPGCVYRASQSPIQPGSTVTLQPSTSTVPIAGTRYCTVRCSAPCHVSNVNEKDAGIGQAAAMLLYGKTQMVDHEELFYDFDNHW